MNKTISNAMDSKGKITALNSNNESIQPQTDIQ